jgi:hypothetical protein
MGGKVRARSGSRELMLTAEGFWPVAPVWGRSEEEMALCDLPVACPRRERLCSEPFFGTIHTQADGAVWR